MSWKEGGFHRWDIRDFQSHFSSSLALSQALRENFTRGLDSKIWWNMILKTNLQERDCAEESLREIHFSPLRNSLRKFIWRSGLSRPEENEEKTIYGQGKSEIGPKQGKEVTRKKVWCITEYCKFICQQFRIIQLPWSTFSLLHQNKNCERSHGQKLIFHSCPYRWFPIPLFRDQMHACSPSLSGLLSLNFISDLEWKTLPR